MADGPAVFVVDEVDRRKQLPGRYPGLGPCGALVIGKQDMPAIAYGNQTGSGVDHIEQEALGGLG